METKLFKEIIGLMRVQFNEHYNTDKQYWNDTTVTKLVDLLEPYRTNEKLLYETYALVMRFKEYTQGKAVQDLMSRPEHKFVDNVVSDILNYLYHRLGAHPIAILITCNRYQEQLGDEDIKACIEEFEAMVKEFLALKRNLNGK